MLVSQDVSAEQQGNSLYAALARTATRSMALYFSRPVRLFRPSKVSGWQMLRGLADHHGESLTPKYLSSLIKQHGVMVIPRHFIPPMMVNFVLGTVLWTTYSEVSSIMEPHLVHHPTALAAISGAAAGGMQAVVAAPAENVRFVLEGGSTATGWSHAWKEVFRGTEPEPSTQKRSQVHEARIVRDWMREVGDMAGRGWNGWGWGCAKDMCGFALFFSIFDLTRRTATRLKVITQELYAIPGKTKCGSRRPDPRVVHAVTLVSGGAIAGLAYEAACRPWDAARKAVHIDSVVSQPHNQHSIVTIVMRKLKNEGLPYFFRSQVHAPQDHPSSPLRRRAYSAMRTLARVGPWGVGFLVWEALGPGLS